MLSQTANGTSLQPLAKERYMLLTTYRKNGEGVPTPVWFAEENGMLYVYSEATAGKIKRLRHTSRVTIAACTLNGKVTGPVIAAEAHLLLAPDQIARAKAAIANKYKFQYRALNLVGRIQRLFTRTPATPNTWISIAAKTN